MRLVRATVERSISEMWDAVNSCEGGDEDKFNLAKRDAIRIQADLHARLHKQDLIDEAGEDLLASCKELVAELLKSTFTPESPRALILKRAVAALQKAERGDTNAPTLTF